MKRLAFLLSILLAMNSVPASTAPAGPASMPVTGSGLLVGGEIVFTVPDGWTPVGKPSDVLAAYASISPKATLIVHVDKQQSVIDASAGPKIGQLRLKQMQENAQKSGFEVLVKPKMEHDDRFFLRIYEKFKKEGQTHEQLQLYRVLGTNLISVATVSSTEDPDEAKQAFQAAESILLSVKSSKALPPAASGAKPKPATKPTVLSAAKISFRAPAGWTEEANDNASGVVATYRDPTASFNSVVIRVTPLPAEAKRDPKARDAIVDQIVSGEKATFKFDGAEAVGDTETVKDARFLRKQRTHLQTGDTKIEVTSRQKLIGDVIVSVASAAGDSAAADIDHLADDIAMSLKPAR